MSELCEDQELLAEFLTEAAELLDTVDDDLVALEKSPADGELLNRVFRAIHSVKGNASFLEFELLVALTHRTEDVLNRLRRGELLLSPAIMDVILESVALVKVLLNDIKRQEIQDRPIDEVICRLTAILENEQYTVPPVDSVETLPADSTLEGATSSCENSVNNVSLPPAPPAEKIRPAHEGSKAVVDNAGATGEELADKSTLRVDVKRVDDLMNQVGELVLERNRMIQLHGEYQTDQTSPLFQEEFSKLTKRINFVTSELQTQVLKMRLIPIGNVFRKFPRIVRNLARDLGKEVTLKIFGEDTELDRSVIDEIGDPLTHLLRNALDHGLEGPDERRACGKPVIGTVVLSARHEGNRIIISIADDGRGINPERVAAKALEKGLLTAEQLASMSQQEIYHLIFLPGFSTKDTPTDLSGRGVGMDVVRTNIRKLNGLIDIQSEQGKGSEFILRLPLTLAIIQSLMVNVMSETYSIPLSAILETIRIKNDDLHTIGGRKILKLRESTIPVMNLARTFGTPEDSCHRSHTYVVIVGSAEKRLGLQVTGLLGQQEVAIKSLGTYLANVPGISGSTIMGDGKVALIVDPAKLIELGDVGLG